MPSFKATHNTTGEVLDYEAALPQPEHLGTDWRLEEVIAAVSNPDEPAPAAPIDPAQWRIWVGSFFDRFGAAKIGILSDPDPLVQAVVKDASVRRYIDLIERRDELAQVIGLLNVKGHAVDAVAVLDVLPVMDEVWHAQ